MTTQNIHGQHVRPSRRGARRFGLAASACLGAAGLAAGAAQAVAGAAVVSTSAHALANPGHPDVFQGLFEVHQFGAVLAASARNQAQAESVQCPAAHPCRSVSLSFQVVTMVGELSHLNAVNLSNARNVHCPGCESLAVAYQFIVATHDAFALSPSTQRELDRIHSALSALSSSNVSTARLKADADALAARAASVLKAAAAAAPRGAHSVSQSAIPQVTVHRTVDQH